MSKEARLCYHAVPKILPASTQPWNQQDDSTTVKNKGVNFKYINKEKLIGEMDKNIDNNNEWSAFNSYVAESRININVRQVLQQNQRSLHDCNMNNR